MRLFAVLSLLVTLSACAAKPQRREAALDEADADRWRRTDEAVVETLRKSVAASQARGAATARAGGVTHVVFIWIRTPGDAQQIEQVIRTSRGFQNIPGVIAVRAGRPLPSTRPIVDSTYDVGLIMTFADEAALQAYETHPQHVRAVREVLRPLAARIQVYDIRHEKEAGAASTAPASEKSN